MIESEDIRVSAKAIIVKDNKLLAAKKKMNMVFSTLFPAGDKITAKLWSRL